MENAVIENKLSNLADKLTDLDGRFTNLQKSVTSIEASLVLLVRLEERHSNSQAAIDRAFKAQASLSEEIDALKETVSAIQHDLPGLKELRKWVIGGVAFGVTTLIGALISNNIAAAKQQDGIYQLIQKQAVKP